MEMKPKEVAALKDWASYVTEKMAEKDALVKKLSHLRALPQPQSKF